MNNYLREPVNGFTHLAGAILSFIGLLALVIKTALQGHSTIALTAVSNFRNKHDSFICCFCYLSLHSTIS